MDEKLLQLKKQLEDHASNPNGQEFLIEKNIYDLLTQEEENTRKLLRFVDRQRSEGVARILSHNLVSEKIEEIVISERGLTKEMIESMRNRRRSKNRYEYTGSIEAPVVEKVRNHVPNNLLQMIYSEFNSNDESLRLLDIMEIRPKGSIVISNINRDCSILELTNDLGCKNQEELTRVYGDNTMNLQQVHYVISRKKRREENYKDVFTALVKIQDKIEVLNVFPSDEKTGLRYYLGGIKAGSQFLTFFPSNTIEE